MYRAILVAAALPVALAAQAPSLTGTWVGSGTLTNDWSDASSPTIALQCVYTGKAEPPAITLTIPAAGGAGSLALDIPSPSPSCPPLRKRYQIRADVSGTRLTFTDPAGGRWNLAMTDDLIGGEVAWRASTDIPNEALAVGFTYQKPVRPWDVPLTRLFGKVALTRVRARREH